MRDPAPWQKRYDTMWVLAVILGFISQYLFVGRAAGVSVPIFTLLFYVYFFYATKGRRGGFDRWQGQSKTGWLLFGPIGLLSLTYAIFANELFRLLNFWVLVALIVGQTMLLTRGGSQPWFRPRFGAELLKQWLVTPFAHLGVPFGFMAGWLRMGEESSRTRTNLGKISLGLLLAAPLLLVVILLLASADGIFMSWLNRLPALLDGGTAEESFLRFLFAVCAAFYLFSFVWGLMFKQERPLPAEEPKRGEAWEWEAIALTPNKADAAKPRDTLDPIVASTVLVCVNAVYVLFAIIQFTYLFGAADGLLPAGTAYAEYARRGFAELVFVALINICILLVGLHYVERGESWLDRLRKIMLTVLMGCTLVMLISAYSRMSLYEEAYGYTQLRLLVSGFMIFLGVLMAIAIVRIWYRWFSLAKIYIALGIAAYVIMNYSNLDARIAEKNIERYETTDKIDLDYLDTLSADAAPALAKLAREHPELEGVDDMLDDFRKLAKDRKHWQSWSLALRKLEE
ncbi:DUF4153 domain-containing protein [Paenibacillus soyae]|uniref:DUF4173 domain-containing protein n=1 Tax=Paenibacillus soyae TaxID=2969249 RepID=A0A9X2MNL1_9BACL|nr:DUF4173 domain-containing protein [Paenibacillus soyae]MCR2803580.1 DUF4173 domain-containing protein [Paenibacillus soyae]